jgi:hypothetical protein
MSLKSFVHTGEGDSPLYASSGGWFLVWKNGGPENDAAALRELVCHPKAEEATILIAGRGVIITSDTRNLVDVRIQQMVLNTAYVTPPNVWHKTLLSRDGKAVVVQDREMETLKQPVSRAKLAEILTIVKGLL